MNIWTQASLKKFVSEKMPDSRFVVVSCRQPYVHWKKGREIMVDRGSGGVISALNPVLQACNGLWVAWGNGNADRLVVDADDKVAVPPENPEYELKRVWLTRQEEAGFYLGFSNEALWPMCHTAFIRPEFRREDWETYVRVNEKFADAILEELKGQKAFIWIQDYHLCLLPKILKERAPNQTLIAHFWHIPWPPHEVLRICPYKDELLEGLLANDLMGFHIHLHCNNFMDTLDRELECKIDRERNSVIRGGHETLVRPFPIGVDFSTARRDLQSPVVDKIAKELSAELDLEGKTVLLGLDRIDYTKGIPERLLAVERMLEKHPELAEKFVFLQMGEPSRVHIARYRDLNDEIDALVERINWKYASGAWKPIVLLRRHLNYPAPLAFYKLSDVCVVSSLHDGMNLVAKEYASCMTQDKGMLVLSRFTGAARELTDAVLVNPYDREQFADAIYDAVVMPQEERLRRMEKIHQTLEVNNVHRWAGKVISALLKLEFPEN